MKRFGMTVAVACVAMSGCSGGGSSGLGDVETALDDIVDTSNLEEAVTPTDPAPPADIGSASALDGLAPAITDPFSDSELMLASLVPSPARLGRFRLANFALDDPNDDGRIGEYWYPPRVLAEECSIRIDRPPLPVSVATYVPVDSGERFDGGDAKAAAEILQAPLVYGVQVL